MSDNFDAIWKDRDIWALIQDFNKHRDSQIVAQKYEKMRANAFAFFRGTCHLFYRDLPRESSLNSAPIAWICGDLHLENFGTYKGDDASKDRSSQREIYFGINDFDEGELAPCTWDLMRLTTSLLLAADNLEFDRAAGEGLVQLYLDRYANTLKSGEVDAIVADNATGIVGDLLDSLRHQNRHDLLEKYTELSQERRQLKFNKKVMKIDRQARDRVSSLIDVWAQTQAKPDFFEVLDIGYRLAGTGSLGLDRYLILVDGKGSPDRNYLLDLKQQPASALEPYLISTQPEWQNQATRVMTVQHLVQPAPPALLAAFNFNDNSYLLRELQPTQDKLDLQVGKVSLAQLETLVATIAKITAFAHLHGSGKLGAGSTQDFIEFGNRTDWQQGVRLYANNYARQVRLDYQDFKSRSYSVRTSEVSE
jgi:uncharacterized protein (DUF2252 family)